MTIQDAAEHFKKQPARFSASKQWALSLNGYRPKKQEIVKLYGTSADASELYDSGEEVFGIAGGDHHAHVVTVYTAKHDCGAYEETHVCSCGVYYENQMNGCWQYSHQREESGIPLI